MPEFYSQYGQDEFIKNRFFPSKTHGFFVDVGAMDGVRMSNSYHFEQLGWNGILVEANPKQFDIIESKRTWPLIKKAVVCRRDSGTVMFQAMDASKFGEGLSGIVKNYDSRHFGQILNYQSQGFIERIPEPIEVSTIYINDIFGEAKDIDILSIDVEGGELQLLQEIDYDRFRIKVITVENNFDDREFERYMSSRRFEKVARVGVDDVFVNLEHRP